MSPTASSPALHQVGRMALVSVQSVFLNKSLLYYAVRCVVCSVLFQLLPKARFLIAKLGRERFAEIVGFEHRADLHGRIG